MAWGSYLAIYFVVWWLCLFIVLPFGVHNQVDEGEVVPGSESGAPFILKLWPKLAIATVMAFFVVFAVMALLSNSWLQEYWR